jgi:alpha-tubulin suppressor-like RCC1 family protein
MNKVASRSITAMAVLVAVSGCREDGGSPTEPAWSVRLADVAAGTTALTFRQVSAGDSHTCGVATDDRAYCWGDGFPGKVGDGRFHSEYCMDWYECVSRPVAVIGGLRFRVVSAGHDHTCGVTTDDRAYCWGANRLGELGIGNSTGPDVCPGNESEAVCSLVPLAVTGGLRFRSVTAGGAHTCGLTTDGLVYCWGGNGSGQLGDGTTGVRARPELVAAGRRRFASLSAGVEHTCGLTVDNLAYCWGSNANGQLGDSSRVARRLRPVRVAGRRQFRQLDAGAFHTCAITLTSRAFCWGDGGAGQLGTGGTSRSLWPQRVAGGLSLERVTAGDSYTCAEATTNRAYCWGDNFSGQLGDGTRAARWTPVAVSGGLQFVQLTAGESHSCGRVTSGAVYCWGENRWSQLGDGTADDRLTPSPVLGPS